jgi:hypothetical protein
MWTNPFAQAMAAIGSFALLRLRPGSFTLSSAGARVDHQPFELRVIGALERRNRVGLV